ncbi:MAG: dTMP kinase [Synergistaceae bacterium]|jgi:dTMP kinase|nr:dTMP kinase [Synergistaceae bacterium]
MFIVMEGIDGSGKTTQTKLFAEWLKNSAGFDRLFVTREPGGWYAGETVRELILGGNLSSVWSEFFAFMLDRCEHVALGITPELAKGSCVLCDRYMPSTLAYQIFSNPDIPDETAEYMFRMSDVIGLPKPDCVYLLDVNTGVARRRLETRGKIDSFDARGENFFSRVRSGYDKIMNLSPDGWIKIDASGSEDEVFSEITARFSEAFL